MKEFTSQVGGRYTYIDDILNLQELSLAITSIFDGCDNFVISGCEISGTMMNPGYVYINGKVRYCSGTSGLSKWPVYIYELNTIDKVAYVDSGDKVGRHIFGCAVSSNLPTSPDSITGAVPQFIKVDGGGGVMRFKDAFFGKYALILDSTYSSQHVNKNVSLGGDINVGGTVQSGKSFVISSGNKQGSLNYNPNGDLVVQSTSNSNQIFKMVIASDGAIKFFSDETLLVTITSSGLVAGVPVTTSTLNAGNICLTNNDIYNYGVASDTGVLNINKLSGGSNYFRDTVIGDGKGSGILFITGSTRQAKLSGDLLISSPNESVITISNPSLVKSDSTLKSWIEWKDKANEDMAFVGYTNNDNTDFYISNKVGNVCVDSNMYVHGRLYVNSVDVLSNFAYKNIVEEALSKKANQADVYTKRAVDDLFIKKSDSISIFVTAAGGGENGKKSVRNSIGAASTFDFNKAVKKSELFKDIVEEGLPSNSDDSYGRALLARQRTLCNNIGAALKADIADSQKDTGWQPVVNPVAGDTELYVRQVGMVVSIQGKLQTAHKGKLFTLPNTIDPPKYRVGFSHNKKGNWECVIEGGSRDCVVDFCKGGCSQSIGFLITYII